MAAEEEYVYRNSYIYDDDIISEDNISYMSMNGISPRSSTPSSKTNRSNSSYSPLPALITSPAYGVNSASTRFSLPPPVVLRDLSDFHYGIINVELAENLCTEFGEFLLRSGRSSCIDLRLTVRLRNGHHGHFTIYKEDHPFSGNHSIYFLDDKTKQFAFIGVLELLQYIVHVQYLPGHTPDTGGKVPLHPCLRNSKMVVSSMDVTLGRIINPNPTSSKTFYSGGFRSIKAVLVKKRDNVKVITEANVRNQFHVGHPNIVPMLGVSVIEPVCLVLHELAQHSLYDYVKKLKSSKRGCMISICHNICCGMIYLHSNNCLIRSLLTRACSINLQTGMAMISDFDKSCFIEGESIEPGEGETILVPTRWAAPEVLKNSKFSRSSDVWSFGVFVWEVFNNAKVPYRELRNEQLLEKLKPGFRLSLSKKQQPYDIILEKCLRYNESNRPSFNFIEGIIQSLL